MGIRDDIGLSLSLNEYLHNPEMQETLSLFGESLPDLPWDEMVWRVKVLEDVVPLGKGPDPIDTTVAELVLRWLYDEMLDRLSLLGNAIRDVLSGAYPFCGECCSHLSFDYDGRLARLEYLTSSLHVIDYIPPALMDRREFSDITAYRCSGCGSRRSPFFDPKDS